MDCGALSAVSKNLAQAAAHSDPLMMQGHGGDGMLMMQEMEWGMEYQHMAPSAAVSGPMSAPYHPFLAQQGMAPVHDDAHMDQVFAYHSSQQMANAPSHHVQQQQHLMGPPMHMMGPAMMMRPMMHHHHPHQMQMNHHGGFQPMFPVANLQPQQRNRAPLQAAPQHRMDDDWLSQETTAADATVDDTVQTFTVEGEPLRSVQEKTDGSAFYKLLRDLQEHKVEIDEVEGKIVEGDPSSAQAATADAGGADLEQLMAAWNAREPLSAEDQAAAEAYNAAWGSDDEMMDETGEDYAERYFNGNMPGADGDWEAAADEHFGEGALGDEWAKEYDEITSQRNIANTTDYPFEEDNMFLHHDNPMQEGIELRSGVASEAVLAFEAACQQDLKSLEAWTLLGSTQAENEKDRLSIIALNNARNLDPKNLAVLAALAVSHTNEGNHTEALQSLRAWLLAHPEYEHLGSLNVAASIATPEDADDYTSQFLFVSPSAHRECCALFETAIELNPADAELHSNLGVLRNLSHEYQDAAAHFEAALRIRPDDAKLWNRLGATLANGNRSRDAVDAYHRALDLNPGYVRAQYNLGVAHSNVGEHHEAAKQLLKSVIMQQGGVHSKLTTDVDGAVTSRSTREIWDVLRMTFNILDRPDLVQETWKMDVQPFLKEFGLESFNF